MKNTATDLRAAAIISFMLVLPFAILEASFNPVNGRNAPGLLALFGLLWLLPAAFIVILAPVVRAARAEESTTASPVSILFRVAFLALIAVMWGGLLVDQMPCFVGVPNCD